jgi:hypothetical protein
MTTSRLFAAIAAVAALWACAKTGPETPGGNNNSGNGSVTICVSPTSASFEADGGTLRFAVTTTADDFTVEGAADWLTPAKNGKELSLTAAANTVNQARECTLTLKAGEASCTIAVSQKAGSPFEGFKAIKAAVFEYSGNMLYMFSKPSDPDYGGSGFIELMDEDDNVMSLWVYTEMFESEEEVEITPGTYTKGADIYPFGLVGTIKTYVPGQAFSLSDEEEADEDQIMGCLYKDAATSVETALVDGTIVVEKANDGTYTIKVDMKDVNNNVYKYAYTGEVTIDTVSAGYPGESDHIDVGSTVFGADCEYAGKNEHGTTTYRLNIYSGDPEGDYAITVFEFNTAAMDFNADFDLSGSYSTPHEAIEGDDEEDGEPALEPYAPGSLNFGSLEELMPGFEMPMGTYVMYGFGDYLIADAYASLTLMKQTDGKYTLIGAIMSSTNDMVMFMGEDFSGIKDLEIEIYDGTEEED